MARWLPGLGVVVLAVLLAAVLFVMVGGGSDSDTGRHRTSHRAPDGRVSSAPPTPAPPPPAAVPAPAPSPVAPAASPVAAAQTAAAAVQPLWMSVSQTMDQHAAQDPRMHSLSGRVAEISGAVGLYRVHPEQVEWTDLEAKQRQLVDELDTTRAGDDLAVDLQSISSALDDYDRAAKNK